MKLINADRTVETLMGLADKEYGNQHYLNGIRTTLELIENEPEAVVRCKDCKHYLDEDQKGCDLTYSIIKPNDYCSYGERKTAESE